MKGRFTRAENCARPPSSTQRQIPEGSSRWDRQPDRVKEITPTPTFPSHYQPPIPIFPPVDLPASRGSPFDKEKGGDKQNSEPKQSN